MNHSHASLYESLAVLLSYPTEESGASLERLLADLDACLPEAAAPARAWGRYFAANPLWTLQEQYTHTFDLNPACPLDVGYYLFGEDYQRGVFLAHLRECLETVGLDGLSELPDHLPVVLRWLARTPDTELHRDMVAECLQPVLRKMDQAIAPASETSQGEEQKNAGDNPYRYLLRVVSLVLESDPAVLDAPAEAAAVAVAGGGAS